jgi:Acetyltransferase (GNAT) domain
VIARPVPLTAVPTPLLAGLPFQLTLPWWRCVLAAALPPGAAPRLLLAHDADRPSGFLALREGPDGLTGLVTPYTCLFQPVVAPSVDLQTLGRAFGRACAPWSVLQLDALDSTWPGWPALLAGFASSGWKPAWFDSFGNWHAEARDGWQAYLAARPGALRETIRRKLRRAENSPANTFTLARRPDEVGDALDAYEAVYRRSWKPPEPYPHFNAAFVSEASQAGVLRMGVLRRADAPIAAQYWLIDDRPGQGRIATVLKLAHDETAKSLSPGTLLTAWMIRALLADGATVLDFGRGDDPYKRLWASVRRQRKGLILAKPWHPRGAAVLARQALGRLRRRLTDTGTIAAQLP